MEYLLKLHERLEIINAQIKELAHSTLMWGDEVNSNPNMTSSELLSQMIKGKSYSLSAEQLKTERIKLSNELLSAISNKQLELGKRYEQLETARQEAMENYNDTGNREQLEATLLTLKEERAKNRSEKFEFLSFLKQLALSEKDARIL